jgi:hypothetical protein
MKALGTLYIFLFALFATIVGIACTGVQNYSSPPDYDLNHPVKYFMPESLTEVSGIAFHHGKNDSLYVEEDEDGKVYYFYPGDKKIHYSRFGKPGDYEDIAILGEQVILLRSDGAFFIFPFSQVRNPDITGTQKLDNILPQGEYEGLYADEKNEQLYALCKRCAIDNAGKTNTGYLFKLLPNGKLKQTGQFSIDVREIAAMAGKKKIAFHPSALAKNNHTNEWYVLSSVNKLLVVTDLNWKVKAVYPLNPSLFVQPEGIAFDNQDNLYISNEGDKLTSGTVFKFAYKK